MLFIYTNYSKAVLKVIAELAGPFDKLKLLVYLYLEIFILEKILY